MNLSNIEIQNFADDLLKGKLRTEFNLGGLELREHNSQQSAEIGVDYFFEVIKRRGTNHEYFFYNQNKGTNKELNPIVDKNHPNHGDISFQLSVRHANYFYHQLDEPLILTLCDINTGIVYWYAIQNDYSIPKIIEKQIAEEKESMQIYFSQKNIIDNNNFTRLVEDIKHSRRAQVRKKVYKNELKVNYENIIKEIKDLHMIDKIHHTLSMLKIKVVPSHLIASLPPFKGDSRNSYIHGSRLDTDNTEFFNVMAKIKLNKDNVLLIDGGEEFVDNQESKLRKIIDFFHLNSIDHIYWNGEGSKEKICIHDLFIFQDCDCLKCNVLRFNFINANSILANQTGDITDEELIQVAYSQYLMGDLKKSINNFKKIHDKSFIQKDSIYYVISKYNLINLKNFVSSQYFDNDRKSILDDLDDLNFDGADIFVEQYNPYFLNIFKFLKDDIFIYSANNKIDKLLSQISERFYHDQFGGRSSNTYAHDLQVEFQRILLFIQANNIVFNEFVEYKNIIHKVLEGFIILSQIKNKLSSRYDEFHYFLIYQWIVHADSNKIKYFFNKYKVEKLTIVDGVDVYKKFDEYLSNILASLEIISDKMEEESVYFFSDKFRNIIKNITIFLSKLDLGSVKINKLISKLITIIYKIDSKQLMSHNELYYLLNSQRKINSINVKRIVKLHYKNDRKKSRVISDGVYILSKKLSSKGMINFGKELLKIPEFSLNIFDNEEIPEETLRLFIPFLNQEQKENVAKFFIKKLTQEFDPNKFYLLSIDDIIPYNKTLFDRFIESVPDLSKKPIYQSFHHRDYFNHRLSDLINLMFKYNFKFTAKIRGFSNYVKNPLYYDWLMNLDEFDYSKFEQYWILEYKTSLYFKAYSESEKLKKEIKKSLESDYLEGVAKIYINHIN